MLKKRKSMPLNEFHASACAMIPAEATRYGKKPRFALVRLWLRYYSKCYIIKDGHIEYSRVESKGSAMLNLLMANGRVTQEESGFKGETWWTYSRVLRLLGWATKGSSGELVWCGPDDAEWVIVTRMNNRGKQKNETITTTTPPQHHNNQGRQTT